MASGVRAGRDHAHPGVGFDVDAGLLQRRNVAANNGERLAVETARILTLPAAACGVTEIAGRQPICTSPRMIAVIAAGDDG